VKDDKGGEEAGETGKPEPVGGIDEDDEVVEASDHTSEVGPPAWLGWVITICSHVLLMALAITATWIFFPRPIYFFIDTHRGVIQEAPPGTHLNRDGTLSIPGITDVQLPPASGRTTPPTAAAPETPKQPAPKPDSKDPKDQNVPRK